MVRGQRAAAIRFGVLSTLCAPLLAYLSKQVSNRACNLLSKRPRNDEVIGEFKAGARPQRPSRRAYEATVNPMGGGATPCARRLMIELRSRRLACSSCVFTCWLFAEVATAR